MICEVTCENIRCVYQIKGHCRKGEISLDDRGICDSCYLLPVDISALDRVKNDVDWESDENIIWCKE